MNFGLPDFRPVTQAELRRIWLAHPSGEVRHLVLEVERYRRLIKEIDQLYQTTEKAWRDSVGGHLVALHLLKGLTVDERMRL
jgi:hypothetical protein